MRHERQAELLRRLKGRNPHEAWPLADAIHRNPAQAYVDPVRFEAERRALPPPAVEGGPQPLPLCSEPR
jgi:hypothetical protein